MNLTNQNFGFWTALYPIKKNNRIYWHCKCQCGTEKDVLQYSLTSGKSKSCGCEANTNKRFKDILGQTFGELTAFEKTNKRDNNAVIWKCKCSCGNIVEWDVGRLQQTKHPHCGCLNSLIGQRFGKLVVINKANVIKNNRSQYWECLCDCGNTSIVNTSDLRSGKVIGCGCTKSIGEYKIANILMSNNILFKKEYSFPDLIDKLPLRYDFAIFNDDGSLMRLIEFDGLQHTDTKSSWYNETNHKHDLMKNDYARSHQIPLVRIPYSKRDSLTLLDLIGNVYLI